MTTISASTLGELRQAIDLIPTEYDDLELRDDDVNLTDAPKIDISLELKQCLEFKYCGVKVTSESKSQYSKIIDPLKIHKIAQNIREAKKIGAIKEIRDAIRTRTGSPLPLKEAKHYIDRYMPMGWNHDVTFDLEKAAARFIAEHTNDFLNETDFSM